MEISGKGQDCDADIIAAPPFPRQSAENQWHYYRNSKGLGQYGAMA
jgi:hypothetical protein